MKSSTIGQVRIRISLALLLAALAVASGVALWQARRIAALEQRPRASQDDLARLRLRIRQWEDQAGPASAPGAASPTPAGAPSRSRAADRGLEARNQSELERLTRELADSHLEVSRLQRQAADFEDQRRRDAQSSNDRFTTAQRDFQARLDQINARLDAAQAEASSARQRASDLESALASLKADQATAAARQADTIRLLATLQDLNRRRESYIDSLLRRYRDISGQLHAMGNVLDSSRDQNASPIGSSALARIESTISLAEEDLRQVNELNLRVQQTEKKLPKP